MSIKVMAAVWEIDGLDPYERLIMLALSDHADDEGRCYPSVARLSRRSGMSERGVQNAVARLIEKGFVSVILNGGKRGANLYIVSPEPARNQGEPPHQMHPRTECTPAPGAPNPRTRCTPTPAPGAPEPSFNHQEPSEEPLCVSPTPKSRRRPETPLPPDWVPSDRNIADAKAHNFSDQDISRESDKFRNHHVARDTRFRDWDAAWRTWLGNAREFASRRMAGQAYPSRNGQNRSLAAIVAERRLNDQGG